MGINRNIVECKLEIMGEIEVIRIVLIETLWNVNLRNHRINGNVSEY